MKLFALHNSREFGELIASALGIAIGAHEEREFEDGEHKCRPLENVRNEDVFVIHSLYGEPGQTINDKLCRLLFFIAALKDASARQVIAVVPYLCYARKDRKTKPRDPVTTRYVAQLFEVVGTDRIITIDVHNMQAFQNSFRCPTEHLEARKLFAEFLRPQIENEEVVIMSPDIGGIKRAEQLQRVLQKQLQREVPVAFMEKYRSSGEVWGDQLSGDVNEKTVVIIDDLISTGSTLSRSAKACRQAGAKKVIAMVTHGIFTGEPDRVLLDESLQQIIITNTIPPFRLENTLVKEKVTVLNVAPLFAEAIRRVYSGNSVTELLEE